MIIKFLCPNGHALSAPENLAGKAGKCPKCGSAFVVPTLEELNGGVPAEPQPPPEEPAAHHSGTLDISPPSAEAMTGGSAKPIDGGSVKLGANVFVFLCPNGHRLNGPPTLKGKAGQCPHCGARFRIPDDNDLAAEGTDDPLPESEAVPEEFPNLTQQPADDHYPQEYPEDVPEEVPAEGELQVYVDPPPEVGHALGYVFARLWDQREPDTEVELFLKEGEIFQPDYYSDNLSCREYGVFAQKNPDGNFQFTVIPWDDVRKIQLRRLTHLPQPMFR